VTNIISLIFVNLVTSKAGAKHDLLLNKTDRRGRFFKHLSLSQVVQKSVTKIIFLAIVNLVTPKSRAKHELLFSRPASEVFLKAAESNLINETKCDQIHISQFCKFGHKELKLSMSTYSTNWPRMGL
jgi:hypothetical protein